MSASPATAASFHLITGAASGIGLALTRRLLQRGDTVMACDLALATLQTQLAAEVANAGSRLLLLELDVRDPAQWQAALQQISSAGWPRLDTLMNVAGVLRPDFIDAISVADIDLQIDVNTKGVIHGTQAAFRQMRGQADLGPGRGRGQVINLCSLAGLSAVPGSALYAASKFAVRGYSLSVAHELRQQGIALSLVCPDVVATPMITPHLQREQAALIFSGTRTLTVDEVVQAVLGPVMSRRPLEFVLPWHRGLLCKLGSAWPGLAAALFNLMTRLGRSRQRREAGVARG